MTCYNTIRLQQASGKIKIFIISEDVQLSRFSITICVLPHCEALCTCRSCFPTATVAQCIQVVSILLHEAKPVLGLFCLHLNTIHWSGHVTSTICRDNWLGFKSLWLGYRISAYGQVWGCVVPCLELGFGLQFT